MTRTPRAALPSCLFATALFLAGCGGSNKDTPAPPPPVVKGDPLYEFQWHLKNTGQTSFSSEAAVPGVDLNVANLLETGVSGSGVNVLVLDDGIDIRHPDLSPNIDAARLRNFDPKAKASNDPTPTGIGDAHGTAVAGIIAAAANNGLGGRGIAPSASLGGANLLECGSCDSANAGIQAYGGAPFSANASVINASYGADPTAPVPVDIDTEAVPIAGFANMRGGKGIVMVKSAGNAFNDFEDDNGQCAAAREHGLSCQNAAFDAESLMPQVVTTGAVNARGVKASYSSAGSSLLVSGLGGEFGKAKPDSPQTAGPAIFTTDLAGCERGYARTDLSHPYANDFEKPGTDIQKAHNASCDYTSAMNGTSAAAPTVTGVVALMLGANPNLTWRDLRLILAKTSRKIDANRKPTTLALAGGSYIAEPAWTRNGAGLWFHNWYGYGLVDAAAAVAVAKSTTSYLTGSMADSGWIDSAAGRPHLPVPAEVPEGATDSIQFAASRTVEAVQIRVTIDGDAVLGDLGIELVSPSGTRSVLMSAHNVFQKTNTVVNLPLMSNAFNDEPAKGAWKLRVVDVNGRQDTGNQALLRSWSLRVHGR